MIHDREDAKRIFHNYVLDALDLAARRTFGDSIHENTAGSRDEDLPRLFAAIDEQIDVLSHRFEHPLRGG